MDPRFQHLTSPEDLLYIRSELEKLLHDSDVTTHKKSVDSKQEKIKLERGFGLSSLFSNISSSSKPKMPKNRFDIEFRSYNEDISLDMEQSPLAWWSESEFLYPNIKRHVQKYFCIPSFANSMHRLTINEQITLHKKYATINDDIDKKRLWLHLNEMIKTKTIST